MVLTHTITDWVFDLDNTLYPATNTLFSQVDAKMGAFISDHLGVDKDEAYRLQKLYLKDYGTSLAGLMKHHKTDAAAFLEYVHDIDYSALEKNERLQRAIQALPGKKYIHTNGTTKHALNVLRRLGMEHDFDGIFDVVDGGLVPKPHRQPYDYLLRAFPIDPQGAVFIEDMARNLIVPKEMGFTTVLVATACDFAALDAQESSIDYTIESLEEFLEDMCLSS